MTIREKLQNFWYYYKAHTLVVLAIVVVFVSLAAQCAANDPYDYSVTLYMAKLMPEPILDTMAQELARFGTDQNGDGKVRVEIIDCSYGDNDNVRLNQIAKLQARLTQGESILFLTDETCYRSLDEMELFDTVTCLPDRDGKALQLANSPMNTAVARVAGNYMPADFFISKRRVAGTAIEGKDDAERFEQASVELLERLCEEYTAP